MTSKGLPRKSLIVADHQPVYQYYLNADLLWLIIVFSFTFSSLSSLSIMNFCVKLHDAS